MSAYWPENFSERDERREYLNHFNQVYIISLERKFNEIQYCTIFVMFWTWTVNTAAIFN